MRSLRRGGDTRFFWAGNDKGNDLFSFVKLCETCCWLLAQNTDQSFGSSDDMCEDNATNTLSASCVCVFI